MVSILEYDKEYEEKKLRQAEYEVGEQAGLKKRRAGRFEKGRADWQEPRSCTGDCRDRMCLWHAKRDDTEPPAGKAAYFGAESTGVFCDVFRSAAGIAIADRRRGCRMKRAAPFDVISNRKKDCPVSGLSGIFCKGCRNSACACGKFGKVIAYQRIHAECAQVNTPRSLRWRGSVQAFFFASNASPSFTSAT